MTKLQEFINSLSVDLRLTPVHLSLCTALCKGWIANEFRESFQVSRRQLMRDSRIQSTATYHKVIRDLQVFGYLAYRPSYHPLKGSAVSLIIKQVIDDKAQL